jgi:dTDP-4-dehydrorhamnose 3,5-epimerase
MRFDPTALADVLVISPPVFEDNRGAFVINWRPELFAERGLDTRIAQVSTAVTRQRGSIRGMHYQVEPFAEAKTVRVVRGAIFDVAVDLRPGSPTYLQWVGCDLTSVNRQMMYIPAGFAHGYQTLEDDTEVSYFISAPYSPPHQRGARWNDPAFGITWPLGAPSQINERDAAYPDFERVGR